MSELVSRLALSLPMVRFHRRRGGFVAAFALLAAWLFAAVAPVALDAADNAAREDGATKASDELLFRRVYAPVDQIDQWPRGAVKYVPMERKAFDRAVEGIADDVRSPAARQARVAGAEYSARLEADGTLSGQAKIEVIHSAPSAVLLALGSCDLAIASATWLGTADARPAEPPREAVLGMDAEGRLMLLVERAGTLQLDWTLRRQLARGRAAFKAALPSASTTRWMIDLPADMVPVATGGFVDPVDEPANLNETAGAMSAARRVWRLDLGGRSNLDLALLAPESERGRVVIARQAMEYTVAASGVSIASTLSLGVYHEPLDRLVVRLDPGATFIAARIGGSRIVAVSQRQASDGATWITLQFPEPVIGVGRTLSIEALAPLVVDRKWRLPSMLPDGVQWQETTARISIDSPLALAHLWPQRAQASSPIAPSGASLEYFSADAATDLMVRWRRRDIRVDTATLVDVGGEARAQFVVDAELSAAGKANLRGRVQPGWIVEGVTAEPSEALVDWDVAAAPRDVALAGDRFTCDLQPPDGRRARLNIAMRWQGAPERQPLDGPQLNLIAFDESCRVGRAVASIAPSTAFQLNLSGEHRLTALTPADDVARRLMSAHRGQIQFALDSKAAVLKVSSRRAATPYRTTINLAADATREALVERYRIRCSPQGDALARVLVRFSPPRASTLDWTEVIEGGGAAPRVQARRLTDEEARAALVDPGGEAWLVTLDQPRSAPFDLSAARTTPLVERMPISLAATPEADSQEATLTLFAAEDVPLAIENKRLTAIATAESREDEYSRVRGAYRYVPHRDAAGEAAMFISPTVATPSGAAREAGISDTARLIAYDCQIDTRVYADGRAEHRAVYALENLGRSKVSIGLTDSAERFEISCDGEPVARGQRVERPIDVLLPSGRRYVSLVVRYSFDQAELGALSRRSFDAPRLDAPVLHRRWILSTPRGYRVVGAATVAANDRPHWTERWFGSLARPQDRSPWNPLSSAAWTFSRSDSLQAARERATVAALVARLGEARRKIVASKSDAKGAADAAVNDWSALLSAASAGSLWVDATALDHAGVAPYSRLPEAERAGNLSSGERLLQDFGLAIVVDGERLILTTTRAAESMSGLTPLGRIAGGSLNVPSFALRGESSKISGELGPMREIGVPRPRFVLAEAWRASSPRFVDPWEPSDERRFAVIAWESVELNADLAAPQQVWIVGRSEVTSAAALAFLLTAASAWLAARRRGWWVMCALAAVALVSLLLPDAWALLSEISAAAWWGLCLGGALAYLPRSPVVAWQLAESSQGRSRGWKAVSAASVFVGIVMWVVQSRGQNSAASPPASSADSPTNAATNALGTGPTIGSGTEGVATVHKVFIPIDDAEKPVGDVAYVPEPLYARIERWSAARTHGPQGALLAGATYRVALDWDGDNPALLVRQTQADFDIYSFDGATEFELPIASSANDVPPRLDGRALRADEFDWRQNRLRVKVAGVGPHRLEVTYAAAPSVRDALVAIETVTVRLPTARLEVTAPEAGPTIEAAAKADAVAAASARGRLVLPLAAFDRFAVRWPKSSPRGAAEKLESEERLWLDARPGSVTFTANVVLRSAAALPEELRIAVDPRLALLSATADGASVVARRAGGDSDQLVVRLGPSTAHAAELRLRFLLQGSQGIGSLRLPKWEPVVAKVVSRTLGVAVDESLEAEVTAGAEAQPISVQETAQAWGDDRAGLFAYRLARGDVNWSLTTRRRRADMRVDQKVAVVADFDHVRVSLDAEIDVRSGNVFYHTLRGTPGLAVDRVVVRDENDADVTAFWATEPDGMLQVFLAARAGKRQRMHVEGILRGETSSALPFPDLRIVNQRDGERTSDYRLRVYRRPTARVSWRNLVGVNESVSTAETAAPTAAELASGDADDGEGVGGATSTTTIAADAVQDSSRAAPADRLVREFLVSGESAVGGQLILAANRPTVQATFATTVESLGDNWRVRGECRGVIADGVVDDLLFEAPGGWKTAPDVEPPFLATVVESPGGMKRLLVRPELPLRGNFRVAFSVLIPAPADGAAPRWRLLDADRLTEFCVLPTRWKSNEVRWDTRQMRPTTLPAPFTMPRQDGASYQSLALMSSRAQAVIESTPTSVASLQAYANIATALRGDGAQVGVATYDLIPQGAAHCQLQAPPGVTLIAAVLEGRAVALGRGSAHPDAQSDAQSDGGTFQVDLSGNRAVQRLDVFFEASPPRVTNSPPPADGRRAWLAPILKDAEIRQTTWTLLPSSGMELGRLVARGAPSPTSRLPLVEQVDQLADLVVASGAANPERNEVRPWSRRLDAARASLPAMRRSLAADANLSAGGEDTRPGSDIAVGDRASSRRSFIERIDEVLDETEGAAEQSTWRYIILAAKPADVAAIGAESVTRWQSLASRHNARYMGRLGEVGVFETPAEESASLAADLRREAPSLDISMSEELPVCVDRRELWIATASSTAQPIEAVFDGAHWSLETITPRPSAFDARWIAAALIFVVGAALLRPRWRMAVAATIARHPHAMIVVVAIMWSLWLTPGWIGWLAIVAAIAIACRSSWSLSTPRSVTL